MVPKNSEKEPWRIIVDMRPENMEYADMKVKLEHLLHFNAIFSADAFLFSLDMKSGYHNVEVDPVLSRRMGFKFAGKTYVFLVIPFGFKLSPACFIKLTRQFIKKWRSIGPGRWLERFSAYTCNAFKGGAQCMQYIDDSAAGSKVFVVAVFLRNAMIRELESLGFVLSAKGELLPLQILRFLGLIAHLACPVPKWHVPTEKLQSILDVASGLLDRRQPVQLRKVGKCVGKLVSVSLAVPAARLMSRDLNRAIYAKGTPNWASTTVLPDGALQELVWILRALAPWNGRGSPIFSTQFLTALDMTLIQDAGPIAAGFSAVVESSGRVLAEGTILYTDAERSELEHVHKELWGLWLVICCGLKWLARKRVRIQVDSVATVEYIKQGGGKSELLTVIVKLIWVMCVRHDIVLAQVEHIKGDMMIANGVDQKSRPKFFRRSRERDRDEWRIKRSVVQSLQARLGVTFSIDRMANRNNTVCPRFTSMTETEMRADGWYRMNPGAFANHWAVDSFGRQEWNYCFPPFALISQVLDMVRECRAWACVVVPNWPSQLWWPRLMELCVFVYEFPETVVLERPVKYGWEEVKKMSFRPIAVIVNGAVD